MKKGVLCVFAMLFFCSSVKLLAELTAYPSTTMRVEKNAHESTVGMKVNVLSPEPALRLLAHSAVQKPKGGPNLPAMSIQAQPFLKARPRASVARNADWTALLQPVSKTSRIRQDADNLRVNLLRTSFDGQVSLFVDKPKPRSDSDSASWLRLRALRNLSIRNINGSSDPTPQKGR